MKLQYLKIFASVYKKRSFSKTSEQFYISQPTVSEHMKNLENELGYKLFDRLGRTIMPTKEADIIYPKALKILEDIEDLIAAGSSSINEVHGKLMIGASTIPGTYVLPNILQEFHKQHPKVFLETIIEDSRKITDMVLNHELLLGIVGAIMEPERLTHLPFIEDELVLACSDKLFKKETITIQEIYDIPFVFREEGSGTQSTVHLFLEKHEIYRKKLRVIATMGSTEAVKQALKADLGASILSRVAIQKELQEGSLKEIGINNLKMNRKFYLITHKKRTLPMPFKEFYQHIQDHSSTT
ncbi:MAG: LysR family transcriptional regulator [SAR324 cluster bacterium]|nr:LysR family transcriptional regulator [SAR324 cluster bacterium]